MEIRHCLPIGRPPLQIVPTAFVLTYGLPSLGTVRAAPTPFSDTSETGWATDTNHKLRVFQLGPEGVQIVFISDCFLSITVDWQLIGRCQHLFAHSQIWLGTYMRPIVSERIIFPTSLSTTLVNSMGQTSCAISSK